MDRESTRRELIAGTAGAAAVASLGVAAASAAAAVGARSEVQALSYALQMERVGVLAYHQVLSTDVLRAGARIQLGLLLAQDLKHVAKLEQLLRGLGAAATDGPPDVAAAQALLGQHQVHRSLTSLPTQHDCLRLLIDVESLTEGAYFKAIPQLEHPKLIRVSVELMGSDAQHWTVLSGIQHDGDVVQSVPYPFVQGSP
jgi:hypothetical protein